MFIVWLAAAPAHASGCNLDALRDKLGIAAGLLPDLARAPKALDSPREDIHAALDCLNKPIIPEVCREFYVAEATAARGSREAMAKFMISSHLCGFGSPIPTAWQEVPITVKPPDQPPGSFDWTRKLPLAERGSTLRVDGIVSDVAPRDRRFILQVEEKGGSLSTHYLSPGDDVPDYARRSQVPTWAGLGVAAAGGATLLATIPIDNAVQNCLDDDTCSSDRAWSLTRTQGAVFWSGIGAVASGAVLSAGWNVFAKRNRPKRQPVP